MLKFSRSIAYLYFSSFHDKLGIWFVFFFRLFSVLFFKWQRKIFRIFLDHYLACAIIFGVTILTHDMWFLLFFEADIFLGVTRSQKPQKTIWSRWMILCLIQCMHYNFFTVQQGKIFFHIILILYFHLDIMVPLLRVIMQALSAYGISKERQEYLRYHLLDLVHYLIVKGVFNSDIVCSFSIWHIDWWPWNARLRISILSLVLMH